jgi:hypothetical protein
MTNRCSAAVSAAVRRASSPAEPMASRHRDSRQDAGATVGTIFPNKGRQMATIMPPDADDTIFSREITR